MKSKLLNKISALVFAVTFVTAGTAFGAPALPVEMNTIVTKFVLAMVCVAAFSLILTVGLSLYNKFFVAKQIKDFKMSKDSLKAPTDTDEAIMSFITKNKG